MTTQNPRLSCFLHMTTASGDDFGELHVRVVGGGSRLSWLVRVRVQPRMESSSITAETL